MRPIVRRRPRGRYSRPAGELFDGHDGRGRSQVGVRVTVDELEQLHGELDVANPARPSFISRSVSPLRSTSCSARAASSRRSDRRSSALKGRFHNQRCAVSSQRPPRRMSPATGRAFNSAWNSQGSAHRSQYASNESMFRTNGPSRPSGEGWRRRGSMMRSRRWIRRTGSISGQPNRRRSRTSCRCRSSS